MCVNFIHGYLLLIHVYRRVINFTSIICEYYIVQYSYIHVHIHIHYSSKKIYTFNTIVYIVYIVKYTLNDNTYLMVVHGYLSVIIKNSSSIKHRTHNDKNKNQEIDVKLAV